MISKLRFLKVRTVGGLLLQGLPLAAIGSLLLLAGCTMLMRSGWLPPRPTPYETHIHSHALHLGPKVGLDCDFCHHSVRESVDESGKHTPPMKTCLKCHQKWFNDDQCAKCHLIPEAEVPPVVTALHFSHKQHLGIPGMENACEMCHTTNRESHRMADRNIPVMQVCLNCHHHEKQYQDLRCDVCHKDLYSVGLKPMSRFSHEGDFLRDHQHYTWSQTKVCAQCHTQDDCMECHANQSDELDANMKHHGRTDRDFVHQADYLSRHFIEARNDPALCVTCHRPSFCRNCHEQHGISDITGQSQFGTPFSPHPEDFGDPGSPNFHGYMARREIFTCAACHDQGKDTNCIKCHSVFTDAFNPHPKGWSSDKDMFRDRPCIYCHVDSGAKGGRGRGR
ncbi:MAG: hypothetical protein HUU16_03450 [Candidatus Omnitrophica bacterium]|nr:hypothetical protein [bacterium]NUN95208.1 hypothetical protein [Candidatus Omnitrophota bacterium]